MAETHLVPATTYTRSSYIDRWGHKHPAKRIRRASYRVKRKGRKRKSRRTKRKWFKAGVHTGGEKGATQKERRREALKIHGGSKLATARALQVLAFEAGKDAKYFFALHKGGD